MVYVRDDGDVTQIFDHNFASGILEIARYCTRINRSTKQDHKHPPQTSIAEFLCDHIHGALKGYFHVGCTIIVLNVHIKAL